MLTCAGAVTSMLRQDALELRALSRAPRSQSSDGPDLATAKQTMMTDIHRVLTLMLGPPPAPTAAFTWTYRDKAGRVSSVRSSPLQFAGELSSAAGVRACGGTDVGQLFSLVHDPRNAAERLLTVARLGNVVGGLPIRYANVARPTIKRACVAMLRRGLPVFFGCDVGKALDGAHGVLDVDLFAHELAFGLRPRLDKADRLRVGESQMTHAMVLTGVHLDPSGCPVRWRIQNSWSESSGEHGYLLMTDAWMDEYVYQAVVDPAFVDADVNAILSQEAQVLPLWDPMG